MRAARHTRWGGPDVVEVHEVEDPTPTGDEVLVRVRAASINRADLDLIEPRPGFVRLFRGYRVPKEPAIGCDVAGVVEAVGPDVTTFTPGDRVFGDMYPFGLGSFADLKVAPERAFLPIPDTMSFEEAASIPHAGTLAVQGLRRRDGRTVGPGDTVLVDGASGGVGPFAVQLAKALGATVTGVASTAKLDLVRELGADRVIDYREVDVTRVGERYDWILDVDGHHSILDWRRVLRRGGTYVTLGGSSTRILASLTVGPVATLATGRQMGLALWWRPFFADDVATLARLHAEGSLRIVVDRRYPLDEVGEALRYVDDGHARGKVVVIPEVGT